MIVNLRQPKRAVEVRGGRPARAILIELGLSPEGHLVICNGTLVPSDAFLAETDDVEVRPVVSGG
jgi:sulfur carrier protein